MLGTLRTNRHAKAGLGALLAVLLVVAMFADTTYLDRTAAAKGQPGAFNPTTYAKDNFAKLTKTMTAKAVDVTTLAPAYDADPAAAGRKYGQDLGAGSFAFAVRAGGRVRSVDANFAVVTVPGLPKGDIVRIPLGLALNGAPVRDATGTIEYGDFTDQTDYQRVADQFGALIKKQVLAKADLKAAKGKKIDVVGAFASGGPENAYLIQPVSIEVGA